MCVVTPVWGSLCIDGVCDPWGVTVCACDPRLRLTVHETVCVTPMGGLPVCECDPRPGVTEGVTRPSPRRG